jgi:hypothetical protein
MVTTRSAAQTQVQPAAAQASSGVLHEKRRPQPKQQRSLWVLLDAVVSQAWLLSRLLVAVGLLGLLALPLLERSISFDENALLAGSARPTIRCAAARTCGCLVVTNYCDTRTYSCQLLLCVCCWRGGEQEGHLRTTPARHGSRMREHSIALRGGPLDLDLAWACICVLKCRN